MIDKKWLRPNTLVKLFSGVAVLWLFLDRDKSSANAIHTTFARECWHSPAGFRGKAALIAGFVAGIPIKLVIALIYVRRCGQRGRYDAGKGRTRQWCEQVGLAVLKGVPSPWYYMFELYRDDQRARALEYLYRAEFKTGLYHMLRARLPAENSLGALSDKYAFALRCQRHDLAVIPIVASASGGRVESDAGPDHLPPVDLFFKPRSGAGGRGASRWRHDPAGGYRANDDTWRSEAELVQYLVELSQNAKYIVRPWVINHPDLLEVSGGALSTVRVLTCLDAQREPVVTHAVMRMACFENAVVDNFHVGGLAAGVNLASGILGEATDMGLDNGSDWHRRHPVSAAKISGRVLPCWDQVLDLARAAHAVFADQIIVGWDIAILADGPYLVEGNKGPDFDIIQRVFRQPVGNGTLGRLLAYHLQQIVV